MTSPDGGFNKLRISYKNWFWIIKLFELELLARKITQPHKLLPINFENGV